MSELSQAVLLAAGQGTRLIPLTRTRPKCMVEVNGRPIVDYLIDALAPLALEELVVVTGFCGDVLADHLGDERAGMRVRIVDNPDYATTNNIYSLWAADDALAANDGGFLLLESDIVLEAAVLAELGTADRMVVSRYRPDMDGTGVRLGAGGRVEEMLLRAHQTAADRLDQLHKTVNFYSFSAATWRDHYRPRLAEWIDAGRLGDYYEAPLAELINERAIDMRGIDVTDRTWAELDNLDDLRRAEAMFR